MSSRRVRSSVAVGLLFFAGPVRTAPADLDNLPQRLSFECLEPVLFQSDDMSQACSRGLLVDVERDIELPMGMSEPCVGGVSTLRQRRSWTNDGGGKEII